MGSGTFTKGASMAGLSLKTLVRGNAVSLIHPRRPKPFQVNRRIHTCLTICGQTKPSWKEVVSFTLALKGAEVTTAQCHGQTGHPVRSGTRDFRNTSNMKNYASSRLLWRISEEVPFSQMRAYKDKLSEEEFGGSLPLSTHSKGMDGLHQDPKAKDWVPPG